MSEKNSLNKKSAKNSGKSAKISKISKTENSQNSPNPRKILKTLNSENSRKSDKIAQNNSAKNAKTAKNSRIAKILVIIFGAAAAIYFAVEAFICAKGSIQLFWGGEDLRRLFVNETLPIDKMSVHLDFYAAVITLEVILFFAFLALLFATVFAIRFSEKARKIWLKISAISAAFILIFVFWDNFFLTDNTGLDAISIAENFWLGFSGFLIPLGVFAFGWIFLTRKTVKKLFR